jgi:hypothetical protein
MTARMKISVIATWDVTQNGQIALINAIST